MVGRDEAGLEGLVGLADVVGLEDPVGLANSGAFEARGLGLMTFEVKVGRGRARDVGGRS